MSHVDPAVSWSPPPRPQPQCVRAVMVGDIVGKPGLSIACQAVRWLRQRLGAAAVVMNAENVADGTGLRIREFERLIDAGVDVVTLGDHVYRKREIIESLTTSPRLIRPANFPPQSPGRGWTTVELEGGIPLTVISLMGRVYMRPIDCPFQAAQRLLAEIPAEHRLRLVEVHAEATSDKQTLGRFLDGRVSAVLGTHTHVTTADEAILPGGTGFQCDIGMTGPHESILGRQIEPVLQTSLTFEPTSFDVATKDVRLSGTWVDIDRGTGRCQAIGRVQWTKELLDVWDDEDRQAMRRL